jgi:FkbM family methyltransferase
MSDWLAAEGISTTGFQIPPYALYYDDEAEIRDAHWKPGLGDGVIDVGARYGSYTLPALAAGATVIAVDPHAEILGLLRCAAELNGFTNLTAVCAALLDGNPYPEDLRAEIGEVWPPGDVQFTTLDEITDGRVDWIKIDVEGAELAVLHGGMETLLAYHPRLLIEDHTRVYPWVAKHRIAERIHDLLEGLDYEIESIPYQAETGSPRDFTIAT